MVNGSNSVDTHSDSGVPTSIIVTASRPTMHGMPKFASYGRYTLPTYKNALYCGCVFNVISIRS